MGRNLFSASSRERREGRLGQVVGAEGEELGLFGEVLGAHAGAHHFEHRAELEVELDLVAGLDIGADLFDPGLHLAQFLGGTYLRHHDLGMHLDAGLLAFGGGLQHGADLHGSISPDRSDPGARRDDRASG
jgi:hypothetical protein